MRFTYVLVAFALFSLISAHTLMVVGAAKGLAALGAGAVAAASAPLAVLGALKFPIPAVIAVKGLGLLKLKMLMKAPLIAPIGIGVGKIALVKAKADKVKAAFAKVAIDLPFKVAAMKIGGVAGAVAGGKTALASLEHLPKKQVVDPIIISASDILNQSNSIGRVEAEPEEPAYGRKPITTTTTTTTTTRRPAPGYTPAPPAYTPAPSYRKRRDVEQAATREQEQEVRQENEDHQDESLEDSAQQVFLVVKNMPGHGCVTLQVCTVSIKEASASHKVCTNHYPYCKEPTEGVEEKASEQVNQPEQKLSATTVVEQQ